MCDNVHSINVCKHSILHLTDSPIVGQESLVAKPKPMRARTVGKNFQLFAICIIHLVPLKILHSLWFSFLLGITAVPRGIENNAYAKLKGVRGWTSRRSLPV